MRCHFFHYKRAYAIACDAIFTPLMTFSCARYTPPPFCALYRMASDAMPMPCAESDARGFIVYISPMRRGAPMLMFLFMLSFCFQRDAAYDI